MRESNSHQKFWRLLSYHLTNPLYIIVLFQTINIITYLIHFCKCTFKTSYKVQESNVFESRSSRFRFYVPLRSVLNKCHRHLAPLHLDDFATQNSVCIKCHIRRQVCSMPLPTSCRLSPLWSSPRSISNSQLHVLPHFHLCPIYLVVFKGSYFLLEGISHLEGGFTLRCLQRLSLPDLATRPWLWQANRSTSGPSIPVLSY